MKNTKLTTEEVASRIYDCTDGKYLLKSAYVNNKTHVEILHIDCNNTWKVRPDKFFFCGRRCPKCNGGIKSSHDEFVSKLSSRCPEYTILEEYRGSEIPHKFLHSCCNREVVCTPHYLLGSNRGCIECYRERTDSKPVKRIIEILNELGISFEREKTFEWLKSPNGKFLPCDFCVSSMNLIIEYQGEQHSYPFRRDDKSAKKFESLQKNDRLKRQLIATNGYTLLELWHDHFKDTDLIDYFNNERSTTIPSGSTLEV